jgi:UDP-N-acetylmuramoyl-tripeptide--D-alanyl-D-alanine ligase
MMTLSAAAATLHGTLSGPDATFSGVATDTRDLKPGDLFVALSGPRFDGHNFIAEAVAAGAAGALVTRLLQTTLPCILVMDTRRALGQLAGVWRERFNVPVVGITGSNGKTTVKQMMGSVLAQLGPGCVTRGNLNNDIGMPLTLLGLRPEHRYAVLEMGMNHKGEIDYLARIARPTVAVINNAAEAHLEGLGSVADVARAKGEIFTGLADNGVAVINIDDPFVEMWRSLAQPRQVVTFGLDRPAAVSADYRIGERGSVIDLRTPQGDVRMRLPMLGKHNVMNALAASAASLAAGASLAQIRAGLEKLEAVSGRLELKPGISGARIIDDTYNANPGSLAAGLQVLKEFSGERALVLGDMAELGPATADIHRRVGELARKLGINRLFAIGEQSRHAVESFGRGARHFSSHEALVEDLLTCLHGDMTVLVKGSRVMKMEKIVSGIVRPGAAAADKGA